jgi:predicted phage tail protein
MALLPTANALTSGKDLVSTLLTALGAVVLVMIFFISPQNVVGLAASITVTMLAAIGFSRLTGGYVSTAMYIVSHA